MAFKNAFLRGTKFQFANLIYANFQNSYLENADFKKAKFENTDFRNVIDIKLAKFDDNIIGAIFTDADFK